MVCSGQGQTARYLTRHGVRDADDRDLLVLHSDPCVRVLHVLHKGLDLQDRTARVSRAAPREQKMPRERGPLEPGAHCRLRPLGRPCGSQYRGGRRRPRRLGEGCCSWTAAGTEGPQAAGGTASGLTPAHEPATRLFLPGLPAMRTREPGAPLPRFPCELPEESPSLSQNLYEMK